MDVQAIIDDIDRQFVQMRKVRELFVSIMEGDAPIAKRLGRPKGSANEAKEQGALALKKALKPSKRTMSTEGRSRIAAAQKKRWAAQKKRWAAQKQAQEPATRKYAAQPRAARKTAAEAKKTTATEDQRPAKRPPNGRSKTP